MRWRRIRIMPARRGLRSHIPAEMADQFMSEEYIFFLRAAANIVDDERVAIGGYTV